MLFGKEHPYDHYMSLPLYIRGPGVPAGTTLLHPTNHLDITATVVELAGATSVGEPLDGKSFAGELTAPGEPAAWRGFYFTEFFGNANTWWSIRRPLPGDGTKFNHWCQNDEEVFNISADALEMTNLIASPAGAKLAASELLIAEALGSCNGAECSAPTPARALKKPLVCKNVTKGLGVYE